MQNYMTFFPFFNNLTDTDHDVATTQTNGCYNLIESRILYLTVKY